MEKITFLWRDNKNREYFSTQSTPASYAYVCIYGLGVFVYVAILVISIDIRTYMFLLHAIANLQGFESFSCHIRVYSYICYDMHMRMHCTTLHTNTSIHACMLMHACHTYKGLM